MTSPTAPGDAALMKAVLFDSGGVLMQPIGGRWHPRADFESTVLERNPGITAEQFADAFAVGEPFMASAESTPDLDQYHAVVLEYLRIVPSPDLLAELTKPVPADRVLELFEDVTDTRPSPSARDPRKGDGPVIRERGRATLIFSDAVPPPRLWLLALL